MPTVAVNGVRLNVEQAGSGPALVLLHGFTGGVASWAGHIRTFSQRFTTFAVDLIGHGGSDSPDDPERYRMERCIEDLVTLFDELAIDRTTVLGYSMGGRVALHLALAAPERIDRLILESGSPGIADPTERGARIQADEALADDIERDGLAAFVAHWERLALFANQARLPLEIQERQRAQRMRNNPLGLANSLRGMGAGAMQPVVERLSEITVPTLLIAGELDEKYVGLATMMERAMPNARAVIVADAGHTVHLEQPAAFDAAVLGWLASC